MEHIRQQYPAGTRLRLHSMADPQAVPPGTTGTVVYVDDMGQIGMRWDNGRSLALVPGVDRFTRVDALKRQKGGDAR